MSDGVTSQQAVGLEEPVGHTSAVGPGLAHRRCAAERVAGGWRTDQVGHGDPYFGEAQNARLRAWQRPSPHAIVRQIRPLLQQGRPFPTQALSRLRPAPLERPSRQAGRLDRLTEPRLA
eukprot:scaffold11985_cov112-Isochrysis_galbana.AAC.6